MIAEAFVLSYDSGWLLLVKYIVIITFLFDDNPCILWVAIPRFLEQG